MRGFVVALLALSALAGCADTGDENDLDGEDDAGPATGDDGAMVGNASVPSLTITELVADLSAGNVPFSVNFSFSGSPNATWTLDADGDGTPDAEGAQLPGNHTHTFTEPGNYTANLTITDGTQATSATVQIVAVQDAIDTMPEGDTLTGTTYGAPAQAFIGRTQFELTQAHAQLDVVVVLDDPMASELGESYTVRFTPPSGGNNDYATTNGQTIVLEQPEVGSWEIGVFMVAAGYYEWTADYCAYTATLC